MTSNWKKIKIPEIFLYLFHPNSSKWFVKDIITPRKNLN